MSHTPFNELDALVSQRRRNDACGKCGAPMTALGCSHSNCGNFTVPHLPDSGARTEFATGAVRDAMTGKGLPSMIPPIAIRAMAKRFEDGAAKYGNLNFQRGIPLSRFVDSIYRHLMAWSENDLTEDHGGAVLWNMAVAMWTLEQIQDGSLPETLNDLPYRGIP